MDEDEFYDSFENEPFMEPNVPTFVGDKVQKSFCVDPTVNNGDPDG